MLPGKVWAGGIAYGCGIISKILSQKLRADLRQRILTGDKEASSSLDFSAYEKRANNNHRKEPPLGGVHARLILVFFLQSLFNPNMLLHRRLAQHRNRSRSNVSDGLYAQLFALER